VAKHPAPSLGLRISTRNFSSLVANLSARSELLKSEKEEPARSRLGCIAATCEATRARAPQGEMTRVAQQLLSPTIRELAQQGENEKRQ
jgi:hypothetical protein